MLKKMVHEYRFPCCVRGYHIYKEVGGKMKCQREPSNVTDKYAVSVVKDNGDIVGYLPRKIFKVLSLFLRRGGTIACEVTGHRRYSVNLKQGGMEIPCHVMLKSIKEKEVKKCQELLQC